MSDDDELHCNCRLCAESTPTSQLISPEDDVGLNSKLAMKMQWINIDICSSLPNSICYSCYDALQRTWIFLRAVRTAQTKLQEIYIKNLSENSTLDVKTDSGKPVNEDWEKFEVPKQEVKDEETSNVPNIQVEVVPIDASTLLNLECIKTEADVPTDVDNHNSDAFNTTDSDDEPLYLATKKKTKRKKRRHHSVNSDTIAKQPEVTWDDYMCHCADCDAQCRNIASLQLHSLHIHAQCCTFKCSDCCKVFTNFKTFIKHAKTHKKSLRYHCDLCCLSFIKTSYLKAHRNDVHKDDMVCQSCGLSFENLELLQDHLLMYSKNVRTVKNENVDSEDLKCDQCSKEFKSRSNLHQHKLLHTERRREFSCHICGKMFFTKGTLSTHMMTHEESKPFKCEFCPLTFRARGNLTSHISLHSDAKPFVCEQCGKSFRVKRHLKSHSIIHTDLMPYKCDYCSKTFRFKTRLNLHLRQHTGAKPYHCLFCQRDFTNGSNYKKHMKRKHNIDTSRRKFNSMSTQLENNEEQNLEISDEEKNKS